MMNAVARITIDLSGTGGEDSIQDAWGTLYTLQQKYMVELKDKQVVKLLLTNLLPKSTRKVVEALQHAHTCTVESATPTVPVVVDHAAGPRGGVGNPGHQRCASTARGTLVGMGRGRTCFMTHPPLTLPDP